MAIIFTITPSGSGFAICAQGKPLQTPGKQPFAVPTKALAEAIASEWVATQKFNPVKMPLTTIAYTAIDRVGAQQDNIVEVLLVYVDTDTLSYRSGGSETLASRQEAEWNPVLAWADKAFGATWATTKGVMPIDQPPELHAAVGKKLSALDAMQLSALCILSSGYSSLALALAVVEKHLDAAEAFRLSRLEEESQAEQWGRDAEADQRAERLKEEIVAAGQFLRLLDAA